MNGALIGTLLIKCRIKVKMEGLHNKVSHTASELCQGTAFRIALAPELCRS